MKVNIPIYLAFSLCLLPLAAIASDIFRETRIGHEIASQISIGEATWLDASDGSKFLAIFTEPEIPSKRGLIILHGQGANPNWQHVIYPLRTGLPKFGWSTLSIQAPILTSSAGEKNYLRIIPDISPRLEASIQYLKTAGIEDIFILGYSFGAHMGAFYSSSLDENSDLRGFIAISLSGKKEPGEGDVAPLALLEKIKIPMLDIYGSVDLAHVQKTASARRLAVSVRGGNKKYRQIEIIGANHFYRGVDEVLVKRVRNWMKSELKKINRLEKK